MAAQHTSKTQSIEITVGGQKILLKAGEVDPALTRQIVELVSAKIKTAEKRGKNLAPHQISLLAMLDLAEEYIAAKNRTSAFKREMNERSDSLMRILETELGA